MEKIYPIGRIYKLSSIHTNKVYIGSTSQTLDKRLIAHKSNYKKYNEGKYHYVTSFEIIKEKDCRIELIEELISISKENLTLLEGKHIKETINHVNKFIPKRTRKEYLNDNDEQIKLKRKVQYLENKEYYSEKSKKYRMNNAQQLKEYNRKYKEEHRDELLNKKSQIVVCDCGSTCRKVAISRHIKTSKHQLWLLQK